jgi:hypothetical protein
MKVAQVAAICSKHNHDPAQAIFEKVCPEDLILGLRHFWNVFTYTHDRPHHVYSRIKVDATLPSCKSLAKLRVVFVSTYEAQ